MIIDSLDYPLIINSESSNGKSSLATYIMINEIKNGKKVCFLNCAGDNYNPLNHIWSNLANIPFKLIFNVQSHRDLYLEDYLKLKEAQIEYDENILVDELIGYQIGMDDIKKYIISTYESFPFDTLFLDNPFVSLNREYDEDIFYLLEHFNNMLINLSNEYSFKLIVTNETTTKDPFYVLNNSHYKSNIHSEMNQNIITCSINHKIYQYKINFNNFNIKQFIPSSIFRGECYQKNKGIKRFLNSKKSKNNICYLNFLKEIYPGLDDNLILNFLKQNKNELPVIEIKNSEVFLFESFFQKYYNSRRFIKLILKEPNFNAALIHNLLDYIYSFIRDYPDLFSEELFSSLLSKKPKDWDIIVKDLYKAYNYILNYKYQYKNEVFQGTQEKIYKIHEEDILDMFFFLPLNINEVIEIGEEMRICVGNALYINKVINNNDHIIFLTNFNGRPIICIHTDESYNILEIKGESNKNILPRLRDDIQHKLKITLP